MPIKHVFEKIKELTPAGIQGGEVVLEDGTKFRLPVEASLEYGLLRVGYSVLLDFDHYEDTNIIYMHVFRLGRHVTNLGFDRENVPIESPVLA